ncbi:hypothetical protein Tco_1039551 [Tanacetum coccineum]
MSSPIHPTSDIEDAFSFNFLDYTPTSPYYFPASSGNISPDPSDNLSKYPLASLAISSFHDDPYMQAYNAAANEPPIPPPDLISPPAILTPSPVLPPSLLFDPDISLFLKNYYHLRSKSIPHLLPQLRYLIHLGSKPVS